MLKILLVEDNEMNRDMLTRRLARRGFRVTTAENGREAIHRASVDRYDLILMDMSLPEVDGWEATRQLRQLDGMKDVPIIALTAHAMHGEREKAIAAGCSDYDTKPVDLIRLLSKIELLTKCTDFV